VEVTPKKNKSLAVKKRASNNSQVVAKKKEDNQEEGQRGDVWGKGRDARLEGGCSLHRVGREERGTQ